MGRSDKVRLLPPDAITKWRCQPRGNQSEVMVLAETNGTFEIVAFVQGTSHAAAKAMGELIVKAMKESQVEEDLLDAAYRALQDILAEGLNFSTEQMADSVLARIERLSSGSSL